MGPFFVTKRVGPVAYELELPQTWRLHPVFHTSLLRPFRTSEWSTRTQAALDDLELEEDDRSYEVERLLRWRWRGPSGRRHREYLVLWAGYSVDDASWTPASNFDYPEELTEDDRARQPRRRYCCSDEIVSGSKLPPGGGSVV